MEQAKAKPDKPGNEEHHFITFRVQTPRGLWSLESPADATLRPHYAISTKVSTVVKDARAVFKFVEEDSKYTLLKGNDPLDPQRTLASYHLDANELLVLSVQGGNA